MCPDDKGIRSSIGLFINLLRHFGFTTTSPEDFRLAKHNDPRAIRPLLRLLYELLYFYQYDSIDRNCREGFDKFSLFDIEIHVSSRLRNLGYPFLHPRLHVILSRELLMKIGWVFCRCSLFNKFESVLFHRSFQPEFELPSFPTSAKANLSLSELTWSLGRLRLRLRELCLVRSGILKHYAFEWNRKNFASQCPPIKYLVLDNPRAIEDHVRRMEEISKGLGLLISWRWSNRTFWKWMQSVLIFHFSSESGNPSVTGSAVRSLHKKQDILDDCVQEFASLDTMFSTMMIEPKHFRESKQSLDYLTSQVHMNLWNLSAQLECKNAQPLPFLAPLYWTYILTSDSKYFPKTESESSCLPDECSRLTAILRSVKNRNRSLRYEMMEYLNNFATQNLPGVLFLHDSVSPSASS